MNDVIDEIIFSNLVNPNCKDYNEVQNIYNNIKKNLESHKGELVLVERVISSTRYVGGFVGIEGGERLPEIYVGIIQKPCISDISGANNFRDLKIYATPVARLDPNITTIDASDYQKIRFVKNNITFAYKDLTGEMEKESEKGKVYDVKTVKFEVHVGNEEVKKYLKPKYQGKKNQIYNKVEKALKDKEKNEAL